jgi:hypothetical protein
MEDLEGSRFGAYPATSCYFSQRVICSNTEAAGGSRERPSASQFYQL